jgi:hypothetical protein
VIKMETKQYRRLVCVLTCAVVFIETLIIIGFTGFIRVEVTDTNCGEVPDEAWEEARRVLGEFGNYASLDLSVRDYGHYTEIITP